MDASSLLFADVHVQPPFARLIFSTDTNENVVLYK